ncbi:MAG: enoyl-CoA hydratase/isomerase family protein [Verrucomicrobia bacterium]|nr:enoyl-CoA hydratase/isomerase family protein [Verrucomicrobiota bacterium]
MADIIIDRNEGIAEVKFNRPEVRNAVTFEMYEAVYDLCAEANEKGEIKAIIFAGVDSSAFASGTDISLLQGIKDGKGGIDYEERIERVVGIVERCRVPTIAAIAGACTGGGAALATACDLRIGGKNLRFGYPMAKTLGNCLSLPNSARLIFLIGPGRFKELLLTARLMGSEEAYATGLINEVLEPSDVLARAREVAGRIAQNAPLTIWAAKEAVRRLHEKLQSANFNDVIEQSYQSEDFRLGVESFITKQTPKWTGR